MHTTHAIVDNEFGFKSEFSVDLGKIYSIKDAVDAVPKAILKGSEALLKEFE